MPRRPGWARGEMHSHSTHSDGRYTPDELLERAWRMGLDFVALTDHNTCSGVRRPGGARRGAALLLPGEELTTFHGHFCLYGVESTVDWHPAGQEQAVSATIAEAGRAGVLTSLAHPYAIGSPVCVGCRWDPGLAPSELFDAVEIWSGSWRRRSVECRRAIALWDRLWEGGRQVLGLAGRDWHGPEQEDRAGLRYPRTMVACPELSVEGILEGLRRHRVYLSSGPTVELWLDAPEGRAGIGDLLRLPSPGSAELQIRPGGPIPSGSKARVLSGGEVILRADADERIGIEVEQPGRYRYEVWAPNGELLLITNHVVLEMPGV